MAAPEKSKKLLIISLVIGIPFVLGIIAVFLLFKYFLGGKDLEAPSVSITSPSGDGWYATNSDSIELQGLAADKSGIKRVDWKSESGTGRAEYDGDSTIWDAKGISLKDGDNKITVTATDKKNKTTSVETTVVYNTKVNFLGLPETSRDYFMKDEPSSPITVTIEFEPVKDGAKSEKPTLYNFVGGTKNPLADLLDNGNSKNGDDIPGDGRYGASIKFSELPSEILLRAGVTVDGTEEFSGGKSVAILARPTAIQLDEIEKFNTEADSKFQEFVKADGAKANEAMAEWLKDRTEVADYGISEGSFGIWWKFKDTGIFGGASNNPKNTRGGIGNGILKIFGKTNKTDAAAAEAPPEVGSTKALYLGPYLHDFAETDDYHLGWETIKNNKCPKCTTTEKKDAGVLFTDFAGMDQYGIILISSHGDTWLGGSLTGKSSAETCPVNSCAAPGSQVITWTFQNVDDTAIPDLLMGRLAWGSDGKIAILPGYVRANNRSFANTAVWLGTCRSLYNVSMASAYIARGASAVYGFTDYVDSEYAKQADNASIEAFLKDGKNNIESFNAAVRAKGANDKGNPPAHFRLAYSTARQGDKTVMGGKKLSNGSFEDSARPDGWDATGDARVIRSLGSLVPQDGKRMGIISTGLGAVSNSDSVFSQRLCAADKFKKLSFKYNFISEEPHEFVGTRFDDVFEVKVIVDGKETLVKRESINSSSWTRINGINFEGGDSTTYHTGWKSFDYTLSGINADSIVEVQFRVFDKGDSIYDSAAIVDAVTLTE